MNKVFNEDCLETMGRLDSNCVDLVVTSPPYDNLRTYNGTSDWNFEIFKPIAKELHRVIKQGGVVVWVVGDSTNKGSESGSSFKQALYFKEIGFNIHDTMIYQKNNFSNPSSNRYHQIFEYMFIFSKGKPKTFNPIVDRKNITAGQIGSWGKNTSRQKDGSMKERKRKIVNEFGMRYNIWKYKTSKNGQEDEIAYKHPAIFPSELVKDNVISWSNKGDLVYDPFTGSGTTPKVCEELERNYLGSEINKEYYHIIQQRLGLL
jgi:site-specific DNA-methyltransferase (adenine-specific)